MNFSYSILEYDIAIESNLVDNLSPTKKTKGKHYSRCLPKKRSYYLGRTDCLLKNILFILLCLTIKQ